MTEQKAFRVVVIEPGYARYTIEQEILKEFVSEIEVISEDARYDEKAAIIKGADAVLVREAVVDTELLEQMENCRVISIAEFSTYRGKGAGDFLVDEIDGNMTCINSLAISCLTLDCLRGKIKIVSYSSYNEFWRDKVIAVRISGFMLQSLGN